MKPTQKLLAALSAGPAANGRGPGWRVRLPAGLPFPKQRELARGA
jgi:hypothetical protein